MSADVYSEIALKEFDALLAGDPDESKVHAFLERNPAFVLGIVDPLKADKRVRDLLISRPTLHGFDARVPDFMVIRNNSVEWLPTLIEIERPNKRLFTKKGDPTADFTQARHQLATWVTWFTQPANFQQFLQSYFPAGDLGGSRQVVLKYLLIYGRRAEFENDPNLTRVRGSLLSGAQSLASFDRARDEIQRAAARSDKAITVKPLGNGRYRALHVPTTFGLDPGGASRLLRIEGLEDAIDANPSIADDRKAFLKERATYWRDWASSAGSNVVTSEFTE
jgi:hypothetical protein